MKKHGKGYHVLISLCLVISLIAGGCTPASPEKGGAGAVDVPKKLIRVGFSQLGAESDWRRANTASMQQTFTAEKGYQLILEDAQQKQANQTMSIRRFIQQGVDYIVVAPATETGWDNVLQEAKNAGIPVVLIDRKIDVKDATLYTCWIGSNFRLEGVKVTGWIKQYLEDHKIRNKDVHIFDLQGSNGATAQLGRSEGLRVAAQSNGWDIVDSMDGDFTEAKGHEVTQRMLNAHPETNIIYCENDNMALGAIKAIEQAGRVPGKAVDKGEIMVVSFDGVSRDAMQYLIDGKIACIGECYPAHGAYVQSVIEMMENGKQPDKESFVREGIYSADSSITQVNVGNNAYSVTVVTPEWMEERSLLTGDDI